MNEDILLFLWKFFQSKYYFKQNSSFLFLKEKEKYHKFPKFLRKWNGNIPKELQIKENEFDFFLIILGVHIQKIQEQQ